MKNLLYLVIAILVLDKGCELMNEVQSYKETKSPYTNYLWEASPGVPLSQPKVRHNVGYDWATGTVIYDDMIDTMKMVAGKWYGKSNLPKKKPLPVKHTTKASKEPQWLRPTGRDKRQYMTPEEIRMWKWLNQQGYDNNKLMESFVENADEDDKIRQIVREEYEQIHH